MGGGFGDDGWKGVRMSGGRGGGGGGGEDSSVQGSVVCAVVPPSSLPLLIRYSSNFVFSDVYVCIPTALSLNQMLTSGSLSTSSSSLWITNCITEVCHSICLLYCRPDPESIRIISVCN